MASPYTRLLPNFEQWISTKHYTRDSLSYKTTSVPTSSNKKKCFSQQGDKQRPYFSLKIKQSISSVFNSLLAYIHKSNCLKNSTTFCVHNC